MERANLKKIFKQKGISNRYLPGVFDAFEQARQLIFEMKQFWGQTEPNIILGANESKLCFDPTGNIITVPENIIFDVVLSFTKNLTKQDPLNIVLKSFFTNNKLAHIKILAYNSIITSSISMFISHELGHAYLNHKNNYNEEIEADIFSAIYLVRLYKSILQKIEKSFSGISDKETWVAVFVLIGIFNSIARLILINGDRGNAKYQKFSERILTISLIFIIILCSNYNHMTDELKCNLLHVYRSFFPEHLTDEEFNIKFSELSDEVTPIYFKMCEGKSRE